MPDYLAIVRDGLASMGVPIDYISSITKNLAGNDIVAVATRLALVGVLAAVLKSFISKWQNRIYEALFPTAYILSTDPAFGWIHTSLAQDPNVSKQIKSYRVSTSDERTSQRDENQRHNSNAVKKGLSLSKKDASWSKDDVVAQILPVNNHAISVIYEGRKLWITRCDTKYAGQSVPPKDKEDHLRIQSWFFSSDTIREYILASHKLFFTKDDGEILIFHSSWPYNGSWYFPIARPSRSWKSVILPESKKDEVLEDVQCFLSDEEKAWYANRGIPHRRGYLLYGPPGSGKTTLATGIASRLKLDLYCINPAARGMDDGKLNKAFRSCPPGNLILIEDIDCVMPSRTRAKKSEEDDDSDDEESSKPAAAEGDPGKYGLAASSVTLSGLLNAIDGVASQEDSVLLASTNYPDRLDDALKRPGRFDVHVPLHNAVPPQATDLFKHFYPLEEYQKTPNPEGEKEGSNKGFNDQEDLNAHADKFASNIFDCGLEVSMAALQGFLLRYKKHPKRAMEEVETWAKRMKEEQDEKVKKREAKREERASRKAASESAGDQSPTQASE